MGTKASDKKNSAKKSNKTNKKSGKTAKKNSKINLKNNKGTKKVTKSSGKVSKASAKNNKKSGYKTGAKKNSKTSGKSSKKSNKATKKSNSTSGKKSTSKKLHKADNLVILWFLWGFILILVIAGIYWLIYTGNEPRKPNVVENKETNQLLVFDSKANKLIAYAPFSLNTGDMNYTIMNQPQITKSKLGITQAQIVPTTANNTVSPTLECKTRNCYSPANIFLTPPDVK